MSASCENLSGELVLFPKLHTGFLLNFIICIHSESNADNLNNVRRDASRHFRNKKKAYLRAKIKELETNSKIKNIRECIGALMT